MVPILRRQQIEVVTGVDVGFIACADFARDQCGVTAGTGFYVAAGDELSCFLNSVVILFMDTFLAVLAMGFNVVFISGRGHVDVVLGLGGEVAGGFGCAGDDVDVATGIELQVAAGFHCRREVFHGGGND